MRTLLAAALVTFVGGVCIPAEAMQSRTLTLDQRVSAQKAIEQVYWRHRIWPEENARPKPPLAQVVPESAIRAKVEDYLQKTRALGQFWNRTVTAAQLQAELERMARDTKAPDTLRELLEALVCCL